MKKYLVIDANYGNEFYFIDDLNELINELYGQELFDNDFETIKGWFFDEYKVFASNSDIIELTKDMDY